MAASSSPFGTARGFRPALAWSLLLNTRSLTAINRNAWTRNGRELDFPRFATPNVSGG